MKLKLKRTHLRDSYTIGILFVDGERFCNTIEDAVRDVKIYGKTAIPTGTYRVAMDVVSPKFKDRAWARPWGGMLPRLLNVPNFEGILIHVGNTADDSLGCILVGENLSVGRIDNSTATFHKLMERMTAAEYEITITIE